MPRLKQEGMWGTGEVPATEATQVLGKHDVRQGQTHQQTGKLNRGAAVPWGHSYPDFIATGVKFLRVKAGVISQ